jgi:predicted DNA-binding transcriptional regulator AlpA
MTPAVEQPIDPLLGAIHELIAATHRVHHDSYLPITGVAAFLAMSVDQTQKRIVTQPDFPAPFRLNGIGKPRWLRSAVAAWARSHSC